MLEISGVSKSYQRGQKHFALANINITIETASAVCITGPNGSGKTTLLKIICGLITPTTGTVSLNGLDISRDEIKIRRIIGYCAADERALYGMLSVSENLEFFGGLYGLYGRALKARIRQVSEMFELRDCLKTPLQKCSAGFRQRAALAKALIHNPEVLVIDELNKSVDADFSRTLIENLNKLSSEEKKTVVFSAHNLGFSGRVIKLSNGTIAQ